MSKLTRRKRMLLYKLVVLILFIVAVWVVSPLTSNNFEWTPFEFWLRVFVTVFNGAWLTGFIDLRGDFERMKLRRPYVFPRFVGVAMILVVPPVLTIPMIYFNLIFFSLFQDILSREISILFSILLSASMMGNFGIVVYRVFDEWYEELNR